MLSPFEGRCSSVTACAALASNPWQAAGARAVRWRAYAALNRRSTAKNVCAWKTRLWGLRYFFFEAAGCRGSLEGGTILLIRM